MANKSIAECLLDSGLPEVEVDFLTREIENKIQSVRAIRTYNLTDPANNAVVTVISPIIKSSIDTLAKKQADIYGQIVKGAKPRKPIEIKKPKERKSKVETLGGRIRQMGKINFLHYKGELKDMPLSVKYLSNKKTGIPIDTAEMNLREEGWIAKDENLLDLLTDPNVLKRGKFVDLSEGGRKKGRTKEQEAILQEEREYEEPPPGEYVTMKAEDLPRGKELTIIDGSGAEGWDQYTVKDKDPFEITLEDGEIVTLRPLDRVDVLKKDLTEKEATAGEEPPLKRKEQLGLFEGEDVRDPYLKPKERQQSLFGDEPAAAPEKPKEPVEKEGLPLQEGQRSVFAEGPPLNLANKLKNRLAERKKITWRGLFRLADASFGGTQAQGKYTPKDAYDAAEMAVNLLIEEKGFGLKSTNIYYGNDPTLAADAMRKLQNIISLLPTQTKRTREQIEYQQFSTPPALAYAVNYAANLNENDVVLEPSAGIGGIAIFPKTFGVKETVVNELSDRRAALLKDMGFDQVYTENAEQIDNVLPESVKPTVIVMNPPFSSTAGRVSRNKTKYGAQHIVQALERLEPNGRLVAIVGRGMADDRPNFRKWWAQIKSKYTVVANIGISGKDYGKYGTTFDNQLIIIDKTGKSDNIPITGFVENHTDLPSRLEGPRNDRPRADQQGQRTESEQTGQAAPEPALPERDTRPAATEGGIRSGEATGTIQPGGRGGASIARPVRDTDLESGASGAASKPGQPTGKTDKTDVGRGTVRKDERPGTGTKPLKVSNVKPRKSKKKLTSSVYENYRPSVKITGAKAHPTPLVESAAMADTEAPDIKYIPNLPTETIQEGNLSDIQIEATARAGESHEKTLPSGERKGFFIGDGTGVGKGREIASIIWDNWRRGRKKAVWLSKGWDLLKDAQRDLSASGWSEGADNVFPQKAFKLGTGIKKDEGILFSTYSTLRGGFNNINPDSPETLDNLEYRINQVVKWLGKDFDGVIAFDESHLMANAAPTRGDRGQKPPSQQALAGIMLQERLPNARVVYVSATGATEVNNLVYASRLGLWGEGTPFDKASHFVSKIAAGGVATMELISRNMKSLGVYLARSLSYGGVKYSRITHKLSKLQRQKYDELAEAWQIVLRNIGDALEATGGDKQSAKMSRFWNAHQRFFNDIVTTMQMPSAIKQIKKDIDDGFAVVLQFVNTGEAQQERALNRMEAGDDLDDIDLTPRDSLMSYLRHAFPVQQYEEFQDEDGNLRKRPVVDSEGKPVLNRSAVRMRDRLMARVGSIKMANGPLDFILQELGHENVAEITGRGRRVVTDPKTGKKIIQKRGDKVIAAEVDDFLDDKLRTLMFSGKGGTGRSFHADREFKNQRKRRHYLIQPGWRADAAVQGLGRSHRSNQVIDPEFVLVTTNLEGQRRFISSIARRLDQLGALTKGERKTGSQGIFQARDNLENIYARQALTGFLQDLANGRIDSINLEDYERQTGLAVTNEDGGLNDIPMKSFLNRLLSMKVGSQNIVFKEFSERMDAIVQAHEDSGTLDVGIETITGSKVKKTQEKVVHTDKEVGAETKYVSVDVTNPANTVNFKQSKNLFNKSGGYYLNEKSGKVWAASNERTTVDSAGTVVGHRVLISPAHTTQRKSIEDLKGDNWLKLRGSRAESIWNEVYNRLPTEVTKSIHLITGNILPVWDRLQGDTKIKRLQTDQGERILGRVIKDSDLENTLRELEIDLKGRKMTGEEASRQVMDLGNTLKLVGGWKIRRSKLSGENRIEVKGLSYDDLDWARNAGMIEEYVQYQTRFFIPTDNPGVFDKIFAKKPLLSVQGKDEVTGGPRLDQRYQVQQKAALNKLSEADLLKHPRLKSAKFTRTPEGHLQVTFRNGKGFTIKQVNEIATDSVILEADYGQQKLEGGQKIGGMYDNENKTITISRYGNKYTVDHELVHYLEESGFLTPLEIQVVNKQIEKQGGKADVEGRAFWLQDAMMDRDSQTTVVQKILRAIADFIDTIINAFGKTTVRGVLRGVESGKIQSRESSGINQFAQPASYGLTKAISEITKSKNFKRWFGKSKVVGEDGEPLVVYHGTSKEIHVFDPKLAGSVKTSDWGKGIYFTPSEMSADFYAEDAAISKDPVGDKLYGDYELEAKRLGTRPMYESIDLGFGSPKYNQLKSVYNKWMKHRDEFRKANKGVVQPVFLNLKNPKYYTYVGITDPFLAARAQENGHDGIIVQNESGYTEEIIVFEPTQIKSIYNQGTFDPKNPDIRYETSAARWYSQMEKHLAQKLPASGTPKSYRQIINTWAKKGFFKQEELDWSGLNEFLGNYQSEKRNEWISEQYEAGRIENDAEYTKWLSGEKVSDPAMQKLIKEASGKTFKLTKQDVLSYLAENNVRVEEVVKGKSDAWAVYDPAERFTDGEEYFSTRQEAVEYADENNIPVNNDTVFLKDDGSESTKFSIHRTPGGSNYRELLLTLPLKRTARGKLSLSQEKRMEELLSKLDKSDSEFAEQQELMAIDNADFAEGRNIVVDKGYVGPHYDEPNTIAHVRFDERTDADGNRVLFIDEVQSDWHQKGRKEGYKPKKETKYKITKGFEKGKRSYTLWIDDKIYSTFDSESKANKFMEDKKKDDAILLTGVPDAPFKKAWPLLAIKRMVRWASANGFDKIAWTPGEIQADRYDLSKQIDSIEYGYSDNFGYVLSINKDGNQIDHRTQMTLNDIENYVGKEIAQKIKNNEYTTKKDGVKIISGLDLRVGGEGMKGFYDKIIPAAVNKFFNKKAWGKARVGTTDVVTGQEMSDVARSKSRLVQDLMQYDGRLLQEAEKMVSDLEKSIHNYISNTDHDTLLGHVPSRVIKKFIPVDKLSEESKPIVIYYANIFYKASLKEGIPSEITTKHQEVWSLPITPPMRQKAMREGMPQYQVADIDTVIQPRQTSAIKRGISKITTPISENEHFKQFKHNIVDKNLAIQDIQKQLGGVKENLNVFMQETQRPKITAYLVEKFWNEKVKPFIVGVGKARLKISDVEELAHALHAPEANDVLKKAAAKEQLQSILAIPKLDKVARGRVKTLMEEADEAGADPGEYFLALEAFLEEHGEKVPKIRDYWNKFKQKASGMTDEEAGKIEKKWAKNKAIHNLVDQISVINDEKLDILLGSGQISGEQYSSYKNLYDNYVPLYREGFEGEPVSTIGRGLQAPGEPIKTRAGSLRGVTNIFANTVKNYETAIIRAEKARSAEMLLNLVNENPAPGFWKVKKVKKEPHHDTFGNLQHYPSQAIAANEMVVKINGERYIIEVNRDSKTAMRMLETLKGEAATNGPIVNMLSRVNRYLSAINTMYAPEFIVSNFIRDMQTAGINIKDTGLSTTKLFGRVKKSIGTIVKIESGKGKVSQPEQDLYKRFRAAGGKISWMDVHQTAESLAKKIEGEYKYQTGKRPVRNTIRKWNDFWQALNTSIENGARFSAFKIAVNPKMGGMSDKKAAQIASDLTVDFTKKGAKGQVLNSLYLFANAGIQGSYRMFRALKNKRVRRAAGGIIMLGFMAGAWNNSQDEDDDIEDYLKERNIVLKIPGSDKLVKIPLPWGFNVFFNIGDEISKAVFADEYDPLNGVARMASVMGNAFNPLQAGTVLQTIAPTIMDPFAMVGENKNWFGGPLMPVKNPFEKIPTPDSQRFWRSVSNPSKWVSQTLNDLTGGDQVKKGMIDVSPETLDLVMDQIGGSAVRFVKDIGLMPGRVMRDELDTHRIPFLRRVAAQKSKYADRRRYYKAREEILIAKKQSEIFPQRRVELSRLTRLNSALKISEKKLRYLRKILKATDDKEVRSNIESRMKIVYNRFTKQYEIATGRNRKKINNWNAQARKSGQYKDIIY